MLNLKTLIIDSFKWDITKDKQGNWVAINNILMITFFSSDFKTITNNDIKNAVDDLAMAFLDDFDSIDIVIDNKKFIVINTPFISIQIDTIQAVKFLVQTII